jgi:hypothetical protein
MPLRYAASMRPIAFWLRQGPTAALGCLAGGITQDANGFYRWFAGRELIVVLCLDSVQRGRRPAASADL